MRGAANNVEEQFKWVASLEIYQKFFETKFLEESNKYFTEEAQKDAVHLPPLEYLLKVERRYKEEVNLANFYLDPTSKTQVMELFVQAYIVSKIEAVAEAVTVGLKKLFEEEDPVKAKKILEMFNQNPLSKDRFDNTFFEDQKTGLEKVLANEVAKEDEKDPHGMTKNMIKYKKKCYKLLKLFNEIEGESSRLKVVKVDDIYEKEINSHKKIVLSLNMYLDFQFREGFKGLQDQDIEAVLDDVMEVFKYMKDRDVFAQGYSFYLSKRLLQVKNLSQETEKVFIGKLRQECGTHFTTKMETMFTDINLSKDLCGDFQAHMKNLAVGSAEQPVQSNTPFPECLDVKVLTTGNWPHVTQTTYELPEEIVGWATSFNDYYALKYPGRKLNWLLSLGSAELRSTLGGKKKEFLVSCIQMSVLMLLTTKESISVNEIHLRTKIPLTELEPHLLGMMSVKLLLKGNSDDRSIKEDDELFVNLKFVHREYRVRVPASRKKKEVEADENMDQIMKKTESERKMRIEACIVRIMKARRTLKNAELIAEVMKMSTIYQFKPETRLIKSAIEGLIEKEYLQRDKDDRNVFHYLS